MRIDPDTKDTLVFMVGLFGIIAQFGLNTALKVPVQPYMLATFGAMIGLGVARPLINGAKNGNGDNGPQRKDPRE